VSTCDPEGPHSPVVEAYNPLFDDSELLRELGSIAREHGKADRVNPIVFAIPGTHPLADLGRVLEARNFAASFSVRNEEGGAELNPDLVRSEMEEHYRPYDACSTFLFLYDDNLGQSIGSVRYVSNGPQGLKTLNDLSEYWGREPEEAISEHDIVLDRTWDIAALVVERSYRGKRIMAEPILNHILYAKAKSTGHVDAWTTILIERYFNHFIKAGVPFKRLLGLSTEIHMREPSVPAILTLNEVEEHMLMSRPRMYEILIEGKGIPYDYIELS
jgi:hypothetical protein